MSRKRFFLLQPAKLAQLCDDCSAAVLTVDIKGISSEKFTRSFSLSSCTGIVQDPSHTDVHALTVCSPCKVGSVQSLYGMTAE